QDLDVLVRLTGHDDGDTAEREPIDLRGAFCAGAIGNDRLRPDKRGGELRGTARQHRDVGERTRTIGLVDGEVVVGETGSGRYGDVGTEDVRNLYRRRADPVPTAGGRRRPGIGDIQGTDPRNQRAWSGDVHVGAVSAATEGLRFGGSDPGQSCEDEQASDQRQ